MKAAALSPLDKARLKLDELNKLLDTPILDTAERGGPLEPFKKFARTEPEQAQVVASVAALTFFAIFFRLVFGLFN